MFIRIYSKLGKEHIYSFEGYSILNNELTVYSNNGRECISIRNLQICLEDNEPCCIYIRQDQEECTINGARYDKESNKILFEEHKIQSITGKYNEN